MTKSLRAEQISVSFDGLKALSDVTLEVLPATVVGLIGPNGAGKTTLVNVLTGFQLPSSGSVFFNGEEVSQLPAHKLRRLGIARTFQGGRLFKDLSVIDNLEVTGIGLGLGRREASRRALDMLDWLGVLHLGNQISGALPYTDERRIGIARALMMEPNFLLLDEPAAGMSANETEELDEMFSRIARELGCGVLLIEHNISLVLSVCSHINVLDSGELIDSGSPAHIKSSDKVLHAYMGTQVDVDTPAGAVL